jgi:hypothetical protein
MFRIFLGWDSHYPEPTEVLAYSLRKHSSIPLEINFLKLPELRLNRPFDPLASTEYTYSRFLVPYVCGFRGTSLYLDSGMLCLGDIAEIARLDMTGLAIRVVKHDHRPIATTKMDGAPQTSYPRKNWSSVMLMNCEMLALWSKDVVETATGSYLHRFQDIPDRQIGDLPAAWNALDTAESGTKLINWTSGGPWLKTTRDCGYAGIWNQAREEMRAIANDQNLRSIRARRAMPAPLSVSMPNGVLPVAR